MTRRTRSCQQAGQLEPWFSLSPHHDQYAESATEWTCLCLVKRSEISKLTLSPFPQRANKQKRPSRARACSCSSRGGTGSACRAALQIRTTLRTSTTDGYPAFPKTGATAGRSRRNPPHRQRRNPRVSGPGQRHGEPLRRVGLTLGVRHLPAPADKTPPHPIPSLIVLLPILHRFRMSAASQLVQSGCWCATGP